MTGITRKPTRAVDVGKTSLYAIVVNAIQIGVLVLFGLYVAINGVNERNTQAVQYLAMFGCLLASWGAFIDIREAMRQRRRLRQIEDLETTNTQMDTLNRTLRAQRHDFLNHLQVIYSLMEMQEYAEANDYLEKVYGEIHSVSTFMRTNSAAVNALLKVKAAACEDRKVELRLDIKSALDGVDVPSWELCRVLGTLIDNGLDALKKTPRPWLAITIAEDIRAYCFTVANNGPTIPPELLSTMFQAGVSTKGEGRGMGLSIVRQTLQAHGGDVRCESDAERTAFIATIPKSSER